MSNLNIPQSTVFSSADSTILSSGTKSVIISHPTLSPSNTNVRVSQVQGSFIPCTNILPQQINRTVKPVKITTLNPASSNVGVIRSSPIAIVGAPSISCNISPIMDPAKLTARQRLLGSAGSSTNAIPISRQISSKISLPISQSPCEREPALQRTIIREMQVRVPNRAEKRFSVLRFHASDRVNLSSPTGSSLPPEVFMQRENNLKQYKGGLNIIDAPTKGAGSEFGREAREEARLRKYGVTRKGYRPEDQPWLFTIGKGRTARKFRGVREGGVSDNVQYFVFCQCKEGNFDAYPVCEWYKMKPEVNYRFLREEEAEAEYSRLHKTFNLFNVMLKRKLGHDDAEGGFELEAKDEKDVLRAAAGRLGSSGTSLPGDFAANTNRRISDGSGKQLGALGKRNDFLLTDLEEWDQFNEDDEEFEEEDIDEGVNNQKSSLPGENGADGPEKLANASLKGLSEKKDMALQGNRKTAFMVQKRRRTALIVKRMRRGRQSKRRRRVSPLNSSEEDEDLNDEARDESDQDDHMGDEVDYMTNSSSDEEKLPEEERERIYNEGGVDEELGLKALLTDLSSDEEEEEHKISNDASMDAALADEDTSDLNSLIPRDPLVSNDSVKEKHRRHTEVAGHVGSLSDCQSSLQGKDDEDEDSSSSSSESSSDSDGDESSSDIDAELDAAVDRTAKKAELLRKISDTLQVNTTSGSLGSHSSSSSKKRLFSIDDSWQDDPGIGSAGLSIEEASKRTSGSETFPNPQLQQQQSSRVNTELLAAVRKYLMRKPITVSELLKKIKLKKLIARHEDAQTQLANVLRQLRPIQQIVNNQHVLSLKR